jgi:hypothetical protein
MALANAFQPCPDGEAHAGPAAISLSLTASLDRWDRLKLAMEVYRLVPQTCLGSTLMDMGRQEVA